MSCERCGSVTVTAHEDFNYSASGLPHVTLVGVHVIRCPNCRAFDVEILGPKIEAEGYASAIGRSLAYATEILDRLDPED